MVKTEHLLIGGAIIAGFILISKNNKGQSLAGQLAYNTGSAAAETITEGGKGFFNTLFPRNLSTGLYNYLYLDKIKELGNPNKWWS